MTNTPSGSAKRPHPEPDHPKRPRDDSARDRDWRDAHARSPRVNGGGDRYRPSSRSGSDRRRSDYKRDRSRDSHRSGRRDPPPRKDRDEPARGSPTIHASRETPTASRVESDREEGEISPRHSPEPRRPSVPPPVPPAKPSEAPVSVAEPTTQVPEMELELEAAAPSVEDTLAMRRARRQAILAKHAATSTTSTPNAPSSSATAPLPKIVAADLVSQPSSVPDTPGTATQPPSAVDTPEARVSVEASPAPDDFALAKHADEGDVQAQAQTQNAENGTVEQSAADYDPSMDRREDESKRVRGEEDVVMVDEEVEEEEDDVDDMFAVGLTEKKTKKTRKVVKPVAPALITTTLDTAADAEGYYQIILGEQLDGGRYQVFSVLGKGMFANVVRARVLQGEPGELGKEVAIKITRSQESMVKAGQKEVQILNKLKQADPEDKKHIVRLERTFEHRGHLCLVFESLSMNLRDVVKRFGKDVGLNIRAVRAYAHQLFLALSLLRKTNVMHADIKPDNILVNEQKTVIKLCDLGSASDASENEITPYLVSRFYRAPEIILGVPYDPAIDIWSIGCTLYELYTGKILFPGRSNNQMLLHMMELKGRFTSKLIKKARFGDLYFDTAGAFNSVETNRVTGEDVVRTVHISNPTRDLRARLMPPASAKLKDDEARLLSSFVDLLDKCLALDPSKRITPREALTHPFVRG